MSIRLHSVASLSWQDDTFVGAGPKNLPDEVLVVGGLFCAVGRQAVGRFRSQPLLETLCVTASLVLRWIRSEAKTIPLPIARTLFLPIYGWIMCWTVTRTDSLFVEFGQSVLCLNTIRLNCYSWPCSVLLRGADLSYSSLNDTNSRGTESCGRIACTTHPNE